MSRPLRWITALVVAAALLLIASHTARWLWNAYKERALQDYLDSPLPLQDSTIFLVSPGDSVLDIINTMINEGVVSDAVNFRLALVKLGEDRNIKAGQYKVSPGTTNRQLIGMLSSGAVHHEKFRIIEGTTFATVLSNLTNSGSLNSLVSHLPPQEAWEKIAPGAKHAPEGMLLAETFLHATGTTDLEILQQSHSGMNEMLAKLWEERADDLPFKSPYEALILASIVEKETGIADERDLVSSVFVNRLRLGMPLQSDPTVIYGMGDEFDGNLRKKDLRADTPFNTYTRRGLPPTPIAIVGKESLQATLHPRESEYLYFVADGSGGHKFSKSLREHNNAVNKYQRKRKPTK